MFARLLILSALLAIGVLPVRAAEPTNAVVAVNLFEQT